MAEIQLTGLSTGIDTSAIVKQLVSIESQRLGKYEEDLAEEKEIRDALNTLEADLKELQDALEDLSDADDLRSIIEKAARGVEVNLISLHTIKPLDVEMVAEYSEKSSFVATVEEHSLLGGLGSAIGEVLLDLGYRGRFLKIGLPDD